MPALTIMGAYSGLKNALGLLQGLNATNTQVQINDAKIALQEHIMDAQAALMDANEGKAAAAQRIGELEQKIVSFENWEAEKERYELRAIDRGAFAYMPKPDMQGSEPPHWLCQTCFEGRKKAILQFRGQDRNPGGGRGQHAVWGCNTCKGEVVVYYSRKPSERWEESPTAA